MRMIVPVLGRTALVTRPPALAIRVRVRARRRLAIGTFLDVAAHGDDEALRDERDLGDRRLERLGVSLGGLLEAGDLADELPRGGLDLPSGGWIVFVA